MTSRPLPELFRRLDAGLRRLASTRAHRITLAVAVLLGATSVGPHRALDDFVLGLIASGRGGPVGLLRSRLDLFTFTTGDPASNRRLMDVGLMLPWWTDPHLRISFFRPVTSVTHFLDERLWPSSAALMHAQSLLWFAVMLAAASALYRRLESSKTIAGLSFLLYALDDAHGPALAWLANRNALIATAFGIGALAAHDAWRREKSRFAAALAPALLLLGLLSGELAIGAVAYLAAYALILDSGRLHRRLATLAPAGLVVVAWRVLWSYGGFGARGSGAYLDPLTDPVGFLGVLPEKLVVLVHGQFSVPPSDLAFLAPPSQRPAIVALAILTTVVVIWTLAPIVRRDRMARFWALGMVFALVPLGATFPSDRLLSFVGLGAMGLLARLFASWLERAVRGTLVPDPSAVVTFGLIVVHLVIAPLLLPVRSAQMEIFGLAHDRAAAGIPSDTAIKGKTVVLVSAPTLLFANYIQAERELEGIPRPAHLYVLSSASSDLDVERTGLASLTLRPAHGFLYTPLERHYRGAATMEVGDKTVLTSMTAEVTSVGGDGRPASVEFSFDGAPGSTLFMSFDRDAGRFVPFALPAPGAHVTIPEEDFGKVLVHALVASI